MSRRILLGGVVLGLAGCNSSAFDMGGGSATAPPPGPAPAGARAGETLGSGAVRVGMILPLTQNDSPSPLGTSMRNAAQLAIDEFAGSSITLTIMDDRSSPEGAAQAAEIEIGAGAEAILGPVYAANVRAVGTLARAANRPVIAFSTDTTVAQPGVYLLSFLIEGYVDRVVTFAGSRGKKALAALAPQNDYGNLALAQFQESAGRLNIPVLTIARYAPGDAGGAAQQIAASAGQIDALFVPDQANAMPAVTSALAGANVHTQLLGTGVWDDARVLRLPGMQGAWFAAPDNAGFNTLAQRYKAKFNSEPTRLASLAYDAVTLAGALAKGSPAHFTDATLTSLSGFNGADGVFRFRANGTSERGLAIMEIDNNSAVVVSPAPRSFAAG